MAFNVSMLVLGFVLIFGNAVFVAAEFSLVTLDPATVAQQAQKPGSRLGRVVRALKGLSTQLSGAQVGITLTTILLGFTTQVALADLMAQGLELTGLSSALSLTIAAMVSAVIINVASILFGELIPKNMALSLPLKTARLTAPLQMAFTWIFRPLIAVLNGTANGILHLMGIEPKEELSSARSASELSAMVRHSAEEGTLGVGTADLFTKSINLGGLCAVDVMTARGLMATLPEQATAADVVDIARRTGHSRFPVIGDDSDDVVGLVNVRRAVAVPFERRHEVSVMSSSLSIEPARVPETMRLAPLLVQLRDEGMQMAVVVDEYGGTAGIVTLEDVVEEVVGEVNDEHDRRRGIRAVAERSYQVPGTLRPDELLDQTGIILPEDGPYETLAGLVMERLGHIPEVGDEVQIDGATLKVTVMEGRRVASIRVTGPDLEEPEPEVHL